MHINGFFYLLNSIIKHFEIPDSSQGLQGDRPISLHLLAEWETEETKNILKVTQKAPWPQMLSVQQVVMDLTG